jgi:hypothetical protein
MRLLLCTSALLLLTAGCSLAPGLDEAAEGMEPVGAETTDEGRAATSLGTESIREPGSSEVPAFDYEHDRIEGDVDEAPRWAMPPEIVPSLEIAGRVTCCFMQGSFPLRLHFTGDSWELLQPSMSEVQPRMELISCLSPGSGIELEWTDEPVLQFRAMGLNHVFGPTEIENRWFGEVSPSNPNPTCVEALEANGLGPTVNILFDIEEILTPS